MTKFEPAVIPEREVIGTAMGWLELWRKGDPNTLRVTGHGCNEQLALRRLIAFVRETIEGNTFLNDRYQVSVRRIDHLVHLSIRNLDRSARHDWREFQQIKNELVGPENEAVELYPAESRLVDNANQFHLWCLADPSARFPIGWRDRMVSDHAVGRSQQRPFGQEEP